MKALVGAFNQEKALVEAFSVIVKTDCGTDEALHSTTYRRANTSINLTGAVADSDLFRSCSNILDKFGSKPTRDNLAVVNGSNRSPASASFKDFLLGRSVEYWR